MRAYLVGIKGSGMANLALLLSAMGYEVGGCDSAERFVTDAQLAHANIPVDSGFSASLLPEDLSLLIYSSAYTLALPILKAAQDQGIVPISYPAFLAALSEKQQSWAVAGTHGKSTTCAIVTHLLSTYSAESFPFYALFGSALLGRERAPYWGREHALFEACEYRDHFLSYTVGGVLITNVDYDHVDYFSSYEAVIASFQSLVDRIERNGVLIYNSDDSGAEALGAYAQQNRSDLTIIAYGEQAAGPYQVVALDDGRFQVAALKSPIELTVSSAALAANHIGALILAKEMLGDPTCVDELSSHLSSFPGVVGRLEHMERIGDMHFYDDYAHHPREVAVTLNEVRSRYPGHRSVVLFSPHMASRTLAFFSEFADALAAADYLIIQRTYASARGDEQRGGEDPAHTLYRTMQERFGSRISWAADDEQAVALALQRLQEPSVCITMGAGNNRALTEAIVTAMRSHR